MESTVFAGIGLHAIGGIAAACCYVSQKWTPRWSWQTYWLVVCAMAWVLMPVIVAAVTTPGLWTVLTTSPPDISWKITLLGAAYGFGGMAFAVAIRHIGFSLTYAIAIGISAVVGTIVPAIESGTLVSGFQKPGGGIVLAGFVVSIVGVAICGQAGFMKEREMQDAAVASETTPVFDMKKGLVLVIAAGVLSGIFGVAVSKGAPIDSIAAANGASANFQGYAKYIFITGGSFLTNLVWWGIVHYQRRTYGEFFSLQTGSPRLPVYYLMGIIGGALWFGQFVFYEQGHARMGNYEFISWAIHMAMLVFFSFGVGLAFKEWNHCRRPTLAMLGAGLVVLLISFSLITYGSWRGDQAAKAEEAAASPPSQP